VLLQRCSSPVRVWPNRGRRADVQRLPALIEAFRALHQPRWHSSLCFVGRTLLADQHPPPAGTERGSDS